MGTIDNGQGKTLAEKIWDRHRIVDIDGEQLLYLDNLLVHEGSSHAFEALNALGKHVYRPDQIIACSDHYLPTAGRERGVEGIADPAIRNMILRLGENVRRHGIRYFGPEDPNQGILHVVAPEQGITQPGLLIGGADSHTTTHGAFGCLAFGIGASDARHVLATQTLWLRRPKTMRVRLVGEAAPYVSAKDINLALIALLGAGGALGHIIEYAGPAVTRMSMEQRMTLCNMAVEAGGRAGIVAPDETTYAYLKGRPFAPAAKEWRQAVAYWRTLPSDDNAVFDREVTLDLHEVSPTVTWGTSPEHALGIGGHLPDPAAIEDDDQRQEVAAALDYMGLTAGAPLTSIKIDRVFIGSCTNGRIEDLRAAAGIAFRGRVKVPSWVVPGSTSVKRQAEREGLDKIFINAGFEWRDAGCSLCTAINGDVLAEGERCASTSNRNFRGRQGVNGRTHLVSPVMAAAAALTGYLTDVRSFEETIL
jgi:3-isopropylmalate/(R)-2-methylmalate dehydratase large subunit